MNNKGFVSLVGAGVGGADYLSIRAANRLKTADIVLYDALIDKSVLDLIKGKQRFYVGKRAGRHVMEQSAIIKLMIQLAQKRRQVVRLKAGDPFVFGRGGEEALALYEAGIGYEVIPGISSAFAAPAFAGIPVTHRGISSACTIVSGHAEDTYLPVIKSLIPDSQTLVILMGYANRRAIAQALLDQNWSSDMPTAMVAGAGTVGQKVWRGQLKSLVELAGVGFDRAGAPVTMVIGRSVALARCHENETELGDLCSAYATW